MNDLLYDPEFLAWEADQVPAEPTRDWTHSLYGLRFTSYMNSDVRFSVHPNAIFSIKDDGDVGGTHFVARFSEVEDWNHGDVL